MRGEAVGLSPPWSRHQATRRVDEPLAVEQQGDREQERDDRGDQPVGEALRHVAERGVLAAQAVGQLVEEVVHLLRNVRLHQVVPDDRHVADVLDHLSDVVAEVGSLARRRRHDQERDRGEQGDEPEEHDGARRGTGKAGAALHAPRPRG